jgi:hypothetical protein
LSRIAGVREGAGAISSLRFYTETGSVLQEQMRIDENGNVGIGTASPSKKLHVLDGTASDNSAESNQKEVVFEGGDMYLNIINEDTGNWGAGMSFSQVDLSGATDFENKWSIIRQTNGDGAGDGSLRFTYGTAVDPYNNGAIMVLDDGGNVGIGNTIPNNTLDVSGDVNLTRKIFAPGLTSSTGGSSVCVVDGELINSGSATDCSASSLRFKENISVLEAGLDVVMKMKPVSFNLKSDGQRRVGLIAEDVELIDKRLVNYDKDNLPASLRYNEYTAILTKAIQEQQEQIEQLKQQLEQLKSHNS